jgi:hypothetical protein
MAQADQDTQQGMRKLKGVFWELELAERHFNPTTGTSHCICKCKVDPNDPTTVCGKKLQLTQSSTSSLRHHIKSQHPLDWAKIIKAETEKAEKTFANKVVLSQVIAQQDSSIEDEEEDLATPGPSLKRPAPGEGDFFEIPKSKRGKSNPAHQLSGKSLFHRVTKYNVKDKKQIYWDLRLMELMVGNNLPYEFVAEDITKRWMEEFQPQYHLKHATTFSR